MPTITIHFRDVYGTTDNVNKDDVTVPQRAKVTVSLTNGTNVRAMKTDNTSMWDTQGAIDNEGYYGKSYSFDTGTFSDVYVCFANNPGDVTVSYTGGVTVPDSSFTNDTSYTGETATITGGGSKIFNNLLLTEEIGGITYVYKYYVEETAKDGFTTQYQVGSGDLEDSISAANAIGTDGNAIILVKNTKEAPKTGSLKLTKVVRVDGDTPSTDAEKNLVNGNYVFTVSSDNSIVKYVQITVTNGAPASYKIADTQEGLASVASVEGTSALISGLDDGDYVITEIEKNGMTLEEAARGDNNTDAVSDDKAVTVHVTAGENEPADTSAAAATFTNNIQTTTFEFGKQWIGIGQKEIEWDRDIQVTVGRSSERGSADNNFSLVYNIAKSDVVGSGTAEFAANGATETTPKLQLTISTDGTTKKYNFKIEDLDYASESDGKYTYFVKETNSQLTGYLAPIYTNASAPTGAEAAYQGGTIVNKQEGGYELPSTGGPGTLPLAGAGALLLLLAGTALTVRKLLLQRNTGKGGASE